MSQPNILLAIADDQSWPHTGAYGCNFVDTPSFDRMAREGILFDNTFSPRQGQFIHTILSCALCYEMGK